MNNTTLLLVLIPSVLSSAVALTSLIFGMLRNKKRKREFIREMAKDILLKTDMPDYVYMNTVHEIATAYHNLLIYLDAAGTPRLEALIKSFQEQESNDIRQ